jgi:hypothetical protein
MLKRWAAWPSGIRWLVGIVAVVLAAVIVWALFVPVPDWLARHDVGSAKPALVQTARDAARGRLLTLVAGLFAAGALVFTALNFTLSRRTFELTEQGQVTDRYTKAIEQLGSDKLDVRIGGIYALERVARDSAKDHPTVMEVLTAFIRVHSREPWPPPDTSSSGQTGAGSPYGLPDNPPEQERLTRPDVQAAVTVVGRRDAELDIQLIDLTGADLTRAWLTSADLTGAILTGAILTGADLIGAHLTGAYLTEADLADAHLAGAHLTDAHLTGARLTRADLTRAYLTRARLTRAVLTGADLTSAYLVGADLTSAFLTGATLTGAALTRAILTGVRWPEGVPVPEGWMADSNSSRLKRADELSEVIAHYLR